MSSELTFEKVWEMFQESDKKLQEASKKSMAEYAEIREMFKEIARRSEETDRQFKETDRQFKETDKKMGKLEKLFTGQWGKLIESLVEGDLINLLNSKGILVERTYQRAETKFEGQFYELDLIAENGEEVVIVEVKTTLEVDDVKWFLGKLEKLKEAFPKYKPNIVYGAIAYLRSESESHIYAMRQGLYVIRATGNSASIINTEDFKPKKF